MTTRVTETDDGIYAALLRRGVSRRAFLKWSVAMAAALALPASYAPRIARAVASSSRLPVVWLRGQDCAGDTMQFLQATEPTISQLLLDLLSVDYHETLMAAAGDASEKSLGDALAANPGAYVAIVEGSIPTADDGTWCMIGGVSFRDVVRRVCDGALATIAVGTCAFDGGIPGAAGGPSGAVGVGSVVSKGPVINLPNCPVNVDNLTATIVNYLTFNEWPVMDGTGRPLFAYGGLIHNQCERRAHYEFGEYVLAWGDEGAQKGWCLYKVGCKGPETYANCATQRYADGTSWPIKAGAGCIGCAMPDFWDTMSPFYQRLPPPVSLAPSFGVDDVGALLVGGIAAVTVVHGTLMTVRETRIRSKEKKHGKAEAAARAEAAAGAPVADPAVAVEAPPTMPVTPPVPPTMPVTPPVPPTMPVTPPVPPTPAVVTAVPEPSAATEPHAVPEPAADAGPAAGPRPPEAG
jgi:hydrogenase small subunit